MYVYLFLFSLRHAVILFSFRAVAQAWLRTWLRRTRPTQSRAHWRETRVNQWSQRGRRLRYLRYGITRNYVTLRYVTVPVSDYK